MTTLDWLNDTNANLSAARSALTALLKQLATVPPAPVTAQEAAALHQLVGGDGPATPAPVYRADALLADVTLLTHAARHEMQAALYKARDQAETYDPSK